MPDNQTNPTPPADADEQRPRRSRVVEARPDADASAQRMDQALEYAAKLEQDRHGAPKVGGNVTRLGEVAVPPPPSAPLTAADIPLPSAAWALSSGYIYAGDNQIFASSAMPAAVDSGTLKASYVTRTYVGGTYQAVVRKGTVLAYVTSGGIDYLKPRAAETGTAIAGILDRTVDVTDYDQSVGVIKAGYLREDRLTDNGTYGSVAAGVKTALAQVVFMDHDL